METSPSTAFGGVILKFKIGKYTVGTHCGITAK